MKYVFLDGEKILSNADLHRTFAEALDFPAYYGSNLDARPGGWRTVEETPD